MRYARSQNFKSPVGRISFAQNAFEPRSVSGSPPKYGCEAIFPMSADRAVFEDAVMYVVEQTWGEKGVDRFERGLIFSPFLRGDGEQAKSKQSGDVRPGLGSEFWFCRPSSGVDYPPQLRYLDRHVEATKAEIYSGCHGIFILNAFAWNNMQKGDGVSFGFAGFQRTGGGDRLGGGGIDMAEWFDDKVVPDEGQATQKTRGGRGAAGFFG